MAIEDPKNYDDLIDDVRLELGDVNEANYTFTDAWIRTALAGAIKSLYKSWQKYTLDTDENAIRTTYWNYEFASPPVIQLKDERPIVVKACLILAGGSLQNSSYNLGHWRDHEVSFSNVQGGKARKDMLIGWQTELDGIVKPPQKKMQYARRRALPGYKNNDWESKDGYN